MLDGSDERFRDFFRWSGELNRWMGKWLLIVYPLLAFWNPPLLGMPWQGSVRAVVVVALVTVGFYGVFRRWSVWQWALLVGIPSGTMDMIIGTATWPDAVILCAFVTGITWAVFRFVTTPGPLPEPPDLSTIFRGMGGSGGMAPPGVPVESGLRVPVKRKGRWPDTFTY